MTLAELGAVGVQPPLGRSKIVTFDSLKIATVWAYLTAATVNPVARLPYVVRIESSEDEHTILAQASSPPVNAAATDIGWNLLRVRAPDLWRDFDATGQRQLSPTGWQSAGVAVLDDGGDYRLRDPETNWQFFFAFATNPGNFTADSTSVFLGQHGTDLGSLVAGEPNNLWGAGVAPRAALAFTKVLPSDDDWGPIVQGLDQAYNGGWAAVLMGFGNCGALPPSTVQTAVSLFSNRVPADAAHPSVGVSLVAPAGNGTLTSPTPCPTTAVAYPAAYPEVIAVAALDQNNATMEGFSVGPKVELSAPGICVNGLLVGGGDHPCLTGTSFAAAHVAGLIAAIRAQNNTWSAADVRGRLQEAATKITGQALPRDDRFGYGLINAYAAAQEDTTRPPVPQSPVLPDDSSRTVPSPSGTAERYYRDIVGVMFHDTTSGRTIRAILKKYQASIIAGGVVFPYPIYYLHVPDPGGTYAAISSVARAINGESGVFAVLIPQWRSRVEIRSRYPNDGPSGRRADWFSPTDATRALLAIRAPLAWGCETGTYGQPVRVAIIDRQFEAHNDLVTRQIRPPVNPIDFASISTIFGDLEHGNQVAGIFGATGDNGIGIAGMMWRSDLTLYALGAKGGMSRNAYHDFFLHLLHINDTLRTRIVSMSTTFGNAATDTINIGVIVEALQIYFRNGGMLIYAIGNNPQARPTLAQLRTTTDTAFSGLDKAVAILRDSLGFANHIITVGATDTTGAFLTSTTYWMGGTDILAPGQQILTLGVSNTTSLVPYGTSFATAYVAGVAAQLLARDPTLTAGEVKSFILRGAQVPRWNPQAGQIEPARSVNGAPETVYQLDAYGALKLAAERQGAPLCGNRVWVANQKVVAERSPDPRTSEDLATLAAAVAEVSVFHGGRRIEVVEPSPWARRQFVYDATPRGWTAAASLVDTLRGGTLLSTSAWSHGLDSALWFWWGHDPSGASVVGVEVWDTASQTPTLRATILVPLVNTVENTCIENDPGYMNYVWVGPSPHEGYWDSTFVSNPQCLKTEDTGTKREVNLAGAFPPIGDEALVTITVLARTLVSTGSWAQCSSVNPPSPAEPVCRPVTLEWRPEGTKVWAIKLRTGDKRPLAWERPGQVFWLGLAESGGEVVLGDGVSRHAHVLRMTPSGWVRESLPPTLTGCGVQYLSVSTGAATASPIPSDDACRGDRGEGTIAPVAPAVVGRR